MNINKLCVAAISFIILCTVISSSWAANDPFKDQQAWVTEQDSEARFTYLEATITAKVKNNNDHVEYFKISQKYSQISPPWTWKIVWTQPSALKMIKYMDDIDQDDLGWKIQAGETKTVSFKLRAYPSPTLAQPTYIRRNVSIEHQFWPLVNEPGLTASWFLPNEIEYLNPSLDLVHWKGHFCFWIKNFDYTRPKVSGIVRAPIVPVDSKLTYSNPKITYVDKELTWADTAAWDVVLYPGQSKHFSYTYQWPKSSNSDYGASAGSSSSSIPRNAAAKTSTSVPTTSETGVPFALFVVAALGIAGGVAYAKFFR